MSVNSAADTMPPRVGGTPVVASASQSVAYSPLENSNAGRTPLETEVGLLKTQLQLLQSKVNDMEQSLRFFSNNIPRIHNAEAYFDVVESTAM